MTVEVFCHSEARVLCAEESLFRFFAGLYFHAAAKDFRIGIGGLSQKVFVVGLYGEERGIHSRKLPRIAQNLVSAEIYHNVYLFVEIIGNRPFDRADIVFLLDHGLFIANSRVSYTFNKNRQKIVFIIPRPSTYNEKNLSERRGQMAMNTEKTTYRGFNKIISLTHQTAVECKFGAEVEAVIASDARVILTGAEAENGGVRYYGKAHFLIVYEDSEKRVCRAEKGVEFSARIEDERCFPALTARARLTVENLSVRREGASVYLTALLGADVSLYGEQSFEYLAGGELICRREPATVLTAHLLGGSAEAEDEFETEYIGDILLHSETVGTPEITVSTGSLRAEGEINLCILALKGDTVVSFERLVPFSIEIPCEDAYPGRNAELRVSVLDVSIHADTNEEKEKCKITAEFTLGAEGCVYEEAEIDVVTDAFSRTHEVKLSYGETTTSGAGNTHCVTERISGKAALSAPIDFSDTLLAVTLQRAEANLVRAEDGVRLEGVALATLIVRSSENEVRGMEISLPFSVEADAEEAEVSVLVCSMNARQRQEGEIDAEATLKICYKESKCVSAKYVCDAEEGEETPVSDCAVSVYIPCAGDGLWELAKSLKKSPEEVSENNPELEFPVKEGQRVVIYRKKTMNA